MRSWKTLVGILVFLLLCQGFLSAGGGQETMKESITYFQTIYDGLTEEFPVELEDAFNFSCNSSLSLPNHFSNPCCSILSKVTPSTPGAPPLDRTSLYAYSRISFRYTLSYS